MLNGHEPGAGMFSKSASQQGRLPKFELTIQSGAMGVRQALEAFMSELSPLELEIEESSTVQLVLAEVINNIMEHAYPEGGAAGPIVIKCTGRDDGLHLHIQDEGSPMPGGQLPLGMSQSLNVGLCDLPEGGFGWFLIKDLAKDLKYRRIGQENHLHLRIAITAP
jgi:serine/threonine-protein kinase RsbW